MTDQRNGASAGRGLRSQWGLAGMLPLCGMILGLADRHPERLLDMDGLFSTFCAAVFVVLVFFWYRVDARARSYRTTWGLNIAMLLVTAIALPWYLARARSGFRVFTALLGATGLFVLCCLMYRLGSTGGAA